MGVIENNLVKILWDFNIYCDRIINARWPDITIIDKTVKLITLVDISVPADKRIVEKEDEKVSKYQDLRIELERLWKMKSRIIPVVIGALGAISKRFVNFIKQLDLGSPNMYILQKSALLGTVSILRKVLQLSGAGCSRAVWLFFSSEYML